MNDNKDLNILFLGDIFGDPGIKIVKKHLEDIKAKYNIDLTIAQGENVSGRKGFATREYLKLKEIGIDLFTLGNHVWAKSDILKIINNEDIIRPANIDKDYPGNGSVVFKSSNGITIRVTSLMGITFNKLLKPWQQEYADNFFDSIDSIINFREKTDYHFIDFHGETTSEKYVLALYLDGKVDALCGTHTHVQTNDAHVMKKGLCYITDAGMNGPYDSAIGANFQEVYENMRFGKNSKFITSNNESQFNAVVIKLSRDMSKREIFPINIKPY
ncbi:metallophosphoesterase YmdB [Mycoplasmopsis maculosa]|uniref:Metallophosphoesterase YmdB n=1 Tax=Mycoplasmopsis maculosa TaxID=114885 RepID=A0A449B3F4_9BACT|nr:TIGR00282 family metallophosphoesterase [Mycoplasmopsis maculosa]VEU75105.1 metallophosphoesterase YmdB [Mycoplasmopsis maculosa]